MKVTKLNLPSNGPKEKQKLIRVGECLYRQSVSGTFYFKGQINGQLFTQSLKTTRLSEARRELSKRRQQLAGKDFSAGRMTLAKLCERYQATFQHQRPETVKQKERILRRVLDTWPTGKLTPIGQIKPSDCALWLSKFGQLNATSRNGHIWLLKALFDSAVHDNALNISPAAHLKAQKRIDPLRLTPCPHEFRLIVTSVRSQKYNGHNAQDSADFLEAMGQLGLGQAELSGLLRRDVDLERGTISVLRRKTTHRFIIPLYPQARALVEKVCAGKAHDERLFLIDNAKKALRAACKRLNLPAFSQRSFRRMHITKALEQGIDVKTIASWQGHRDQGVLILKTYSHLRTEHAQAMAQRMV